MRVDQPSARLLAQPGDPREALRQLPEFLAERYGVQFRFGVAVRAIDLPAIRAGSEAWRADRAIVCGGHDFETLYPEAFASSGITCCKLQMMRTAPQPAGWRIGPSLAAGLTLRFYPSFEICPSLAALKKRIAEQTPEYDRWGIHVLISQTTAGEVTIGDSHEYSSGVDIFDKSKIDALILDYAAGFLQLPDAAIAEHRHGIYAKHPSQPYFSIEPASQVRIVTALGGSGMTLSFGLAEQTIREMVG